MIKIYHFISDTNVGGAGKLLCNQIKHMQTKNFEITVVLPQDSALKNELSNLSCKIIESKHGADQSFSVPATLEAYEILKRDKPNIVHSHGSLSSRIAATACGIKSRIFTKHCAFSPSRSAQNPIIKMAFGTANNMLSTSTIAVADCAKQNLIKRGCDKKSIITVINGADPVRLLSNSEKCFLKVQYGLSDKNFVITIVARLVKNKDQATFLRAAAICKKYYPELRFFIVGDGAQKNALLTLCHQLNIEDIVHFTGFCNDVAPILNITNLVVNCSCESETSSLALSEAMSIGIPCIASDCGGNVHMVKNTINGLIFQAKNADALAFAIIRLYRDKELYKKCSTGALRRYNEEFSAHKMAQKMVSIYKNEYSKNKK